MTNTTNTLAVKVDFYFEDKEGMELTQKHYENIQRKVATVVKNTEYAANASFFSDRFTVTAIISFDLDLTGDYERKAIDKLRAPLTRLIDTHKQAATYEWNNGKTITNYKHTNPFTNN